jgi:hypothetical protein
MSREVSRRTGHCGAQPERPANTDCGQAITPGAESGLPVPKKVGYGLPSTFRHSFTTLPTSWERCAGGWLPLDGSCTRGWRMGYDDELRGMLSETEIEHWKISANSAASTISAMARFFGV